MKRTLLEMIAVALVVALAVAGFAWPVPLAPAHHFVGASWNDAHSIAWTLHFVAERLASGELPWGETDRIEWPKGGVLFPALPTGAVAVAPITWAFGPVVAYNGLAIGHHALTAAATWGWLRREELPLAGAAVGAIALGFCPALVASTFNGNPDVTPWFWIPAALWVARRPGPARAALAAALVTLGGLSNPYVGLMAGAAVAVRLGSSARWRDLALVAALSAVGALLVVSAIDAALSAPNAAIVKGPRASLVGTASAVSLVRPAPFVLPTDVDWGLPRVATSAYLGWSLLLLAPFGRRDRAFGWGLVALGVVAALGPELRVLEQDPAAGPALLGSGIALPWRLVEGLPGVSQLHLTSRLSGIAVLGLAWLAADAVSRLDRLRWAAVLLVALDLLLLARGAVLLGSAPIWQDDAQELLAERERGPVVDLPLTYHELWLFDAIGHGNPVAEGINRPIPASVRKRMERRPPEQRVSVLAATGYRWLVDRRALSGGRFDDQLAPVAVCRVAQTETVGLYDLACVRERFPMRSRPAAAEPR